MYGELRSSITMKWSLERLKPEAKVKVYNLVKVIDLLEPSLELVITEFNKSQRLHNDAYKGHVAMKIHEETSTLTVVEVTIENIQEDDYKAYFLKLDLKFDGWEPSSPNSMIHIISPNERGKLATIFLCIFSTNTNTSMHDFQHTTTNTGDSYTHTYK